MTDPVQVQECVDFTVREYGTVDILVNNAQVPPLGPIAEIPEVALRGGVAAPGRWRRSGSCGRAIRTSRAAG